VAATLLASRRRWRRLYWLVAAVVLGFTGAILNAWILLVEIVR
jgi:hypothetical protein